MRFVTVATVSFRSTVGRLVKSLRRVHPEAPLDVYVDACEPFSSLNSEYVTVRVLPEIERLGVKRAKFAMYLDALSRGPFVYLDADVVVLDRLDELWAETGLTGAADGLEACPFIPDKAHPWPGDPALQNDRYINSGVIGFGADAIDFVARAADLAADDAFWKAHTIPAQLYDNHVLCAVLNMSDVPLRLVSGSRFNWQGFLDVKGAVVARLQDGHPVNPDGDPLALVHFAGIGDIDDFLLGIDPGLAAAINAVSVEPLAPARAAAAVSAERGAALCADADPHRSVTAAVLARQFVWAWDQRAVDSTGGYVDDVESLASVAFAVPPQDVRWNGLQCGGAYLEPSEYVFLRACARSVGGGTTVELGAGETSLILSGLADRCISIDPHEGPWLERALKAGVDARHIALVAGRFDERELDRALEGVGVIDLLFVDSPNGTALRRSVLRQMVEQSTPRHLVLHDARRDALALLDELTEFGYTVASALPSYRGMLVLSRRGAEPLRPPPPPPPVGGLVAPRASIGGPDRVGTESSIRIRVANDGDEVWPCDGMQPVRLSYHLTGERGVTVFDGTRTGLPCDVWPGDELELALRVEIPHASGSSEIQITLVQEGVAWFDVLDPANVHRAGIG